MCMCMFTSARISTLQGRFDNRCVGEGGRILLILCNAHTAFNTLIASICVNVSVAQQSVTLPRSSLFTVTPVYSCVSQIKNKQTTITLAFYYPLWCVKACVYFFFCIPLHLVHNLTGCMRTQLMSMCVDHRRMEMAEVDA